MERTSTQVEGRLGNTVVERSAAGDLTVDARLVAPRLGLPPDALMAEIRRGIVYQTCEVGTGADAGRMRITFRYRSRRAVFILDDAGRVIESG